ncbi:CAP domain-containing protein [Sorangium cellulosum]|nr:CAP domain-containing protein [Sorangium cellulosum]
MAPIQSLRSPALNAKLPHGRDQKRRSSGIQAQGHDRRARGGGEACVKNLACKLDPPPSTGDLAQDCVDRINQFLTQCACLPALKRRKDGEACANEMAKYDADHNMAHAGIRAKICEPGGSQNSCPGYSSNKQVIGLCMQQMWDEGPPPTADCTGDCYEMYGHFINMTDDSVTQVACGFYTTSSGKVWAVQNFTR